MLETYCKTCQGPIVRSRRRAGERLLNLIVKFRPYRCLWCRARFWSKTFAVLLLLAGTASAAEASAFLRLEDGASVVQIVDNGPGDANALAGVVMFSGGIGAYTVNVTTGVSRPVVGDLFRAALDLNSIDVVTAAGGGTLTITFADTGYDFAFLSNVWMAALAQIGGTVGPGGSLSVESYINLANASPLPAALVPGASVIPPGSILVQNSTFGPGAFSDTDSALAFYNGGLFSLFTQVRITLPTPGTSISFNDALEVAVPEPISLTLVALGLGSRGLAVRWQRRRSRQSRP